MPILGILSIMRIMRVYKLYSENTVRRHFRYFVTSPAETRYKGQEKMSYEKYQASIKARPLRDRPGIRALLKYPGPKTEAEAIEIAEKAFLAGFEAGLEKGKKKVLGLIYDLGPEVRKSFEEKYFDPS